MAQPTYDDVNLILKLYEMRREAKMREARNWFFGNFKYKSLAEYQQACPMGSDANAFARQVTSYWDMVASFINAGVLNPELCFASNREMLLCWLRVSPIIEETRKAFGGAGYLGNLEKAGKAFLEWLDKSSGSGTSAAFAKRVGA